jgi:hypothetical protein
VTFFTEEVRRRDAHIVERDLAVPVPGVIAEHRQRAHDVHTGRIHGDQHEAVL